MTTVTENEITPRLESIWLSGTSGTSGATPRAGKQPALSREQIVAATIRMLDEEGLTVLSMRRLAGDLGIAPMSLYWHVPTKDALLEFALDAMFGELDLHPDTGGDWGQRAEHIANDLRRTIRAHPWMSPLAGSYATVGPNALAMFEALIELAEEGGYRPPAAYRAVGTLVNFVLGFVADEVKWLNRMRETGLDPKQIEQIWQPPMLAALGDRYPRMRANIEAGDSRDWDDQFEFGLGCMVDGMRARAPRA
jgi:AcrR family transcriptional regulator